jgi:ATP-binding cassette subfamily C protein
MSEVFESIAWLKRRLGDRIQEVLVQGDEPLVLDDPSCAYLTLSEHHQLFCVGYESGKPRGRREHLAVCAPGQLLFGLPPPEHKDATALLLSGATGSRVWRVPMASLLKLSDQPEGRRALAQLFDRWIALLIEALPDAQVPTKARAVRAGETIDKGTKLPLQASEGVVWVAPREQPTSYAGLNVARYGVRPDCWPLAAHAWVQCPDEALRIWSTEQLLEASSDASFATGFYSFVVTAISAQRGELATDRLQRDAASLWADEDFVASALGSLASIGSGVRAVPMRRDANAYDRACTTIFEWLKLDPLPRIVPPRSPSLGHMDVALTRITGVRTRAVLLDQKFLADDCGPILGFVVEGNDPEAPPTPVALLPGPRGYRLIDPETGASRRLDAELLERLHPHAHQFYATFPEKPLNPFSVFRFAAARTQGDVIRVLVIGLLTGALSTLVPLLTGQIFDRIIPGAERSLLWQLMSVLLFVYAGSWLFDAARGFALVRSQTRMDATLEAGVWDRLLSLPLPFFRDYSAGDLASRAAGIGSMREVLAQVGLSTILGGLFSVWNFVLLFYFDLGLALGATGLVAIAALVAMAATYYELGLQRTLATLDGRIGGLLLQLLNGIAKLRVAGGENRAFGVWAKLFAERRDAQMRAERIHNNVAVFQAAYPVLCSAALFWLMAGGEGQSLSTGQFLAFSTAFSLFSRAVLDLIGAGLKSLALIPLYERARPILTSPVESRGHSDVRIDLEGGIELSHISFRYQPQSPLILDDLSLRIKPGEFVAIVGPSGSGKSTLLRTMLGFEPPTEGGVFYDGQALAAMDVRGVRQQIGVVLQHSNVMAGDIYTNIVGSSGLSLDDAWRAARQAAFDKDIEDMPMGMHTVLTQGGGSLSGGQRQRLLIARALAAQPKILYFDEATSALDNRTQAAVSESLERLQVTRVVIAHRLSTIQHADTIVVLERGRIVQQGRFDALLKEGGTFGALAKRQIV